MKADWDRWMSEHAKMITLTEAAGRTKAVAVDWPKMMAIADNRRSYGEEWYIAAAPISVRLYVVVFTIRNATARVISLRKANRREIKRYETQDWQD